MLTRVNGASELGRLAKHNGTLLTVPSESLEVSEEAIKQRLSEAKELLLKNFRNNGEPSPFSALEDTVAAACVQRPSLLVEGELQSTRYFRPLDSTGDSKLSTLYLSPWSRFEKASATELAGEVERLLRRALSENRIPPPDARIQSSSDEVLSLACAACGSRLRILRMFSATTARYDCGMCRRCNVVLCPLCFPEHVHKFTVRDKCRKCGGSGVFSQLVAQKQSFWRKLRDERPEYDLVTEPCSSCQGQGFTEG